MKKEGDLMQKKCPMRCFAVFFLLLLMTCFGSAQNRRDQYDQPEKLAEITGVKPGMIIGEAGAGRGYLTFYLAELVGPEGRIYANDIDSWSLRLLNERCQREGVTNIETVKGEVDDPLFPVGNLDMVVMLRALHDFTEKEAWLLNLKKYIKPEAHLVIFEEEDSHTKMSEKFMKELAERTGYELLKHVHLHNGIWLYLLRADQHNLK